MEGAKGQEFMKTFVDLLKTNHNLRNYFKNFTNVSCTSAKSMQLIVRLLCFCIVFIWLLTWNTS